MSEPHRQNLLAALWREFEAAPPIVFKRHAYLCTPGAFEKNVYWVEQGCLRIFGNEAGHGQTTRFAYSGNMFALLDAFLTDQPTLFFVRRSCRALPTGA